MCTCALLLEADGIIRRDSTADVTNHEAVRPVTGATPVGAWTEYAPPVPTRSPRRILWTDICKFLAGAFFVSSGVLGYLYFTRTPVPLLGTDIVIQPGTHAVRAVIHGVLFAVCFYVGFLRRPRDREA